MQYVLRLQLIVLLLLLPKVALRADHLDSLHVAVEMEATGNVSGDYTPLWLHSNKYGLSSVEANSGYARVMAERSISADDGKKWGLGYGADLVGAVHFTSPFIVHQAYVKGRFMNASLTIGSKEDELNLKPQGLTMGSQALGINARTIPQVRFAFDDYMFVLGHKVHWFAIKGHISYGRMTDDKWQKDFTGGIHTYNKNVLFHSKSGFARFGNPERPFTLELGLEAATQFGGDLFYSTEKDPKGKWGHNDSGFSAFWHALTFGGQDYYENSESGSGGSGNTLGAMLARINLNYDDWYLGLYGDHYFEDHSQLFFIDYDGYGEGDDWNVKKYNRWVHYKFRDVMLGAELKLKQFPYLSHIVLEGIYTKHQSGDRFHEHSKDDPSHFAGRDNYYNHRIYSGWQHWGQALGNPLYTSPLYNTDGRIYFHNNRFVGYHLGLAGTPLPRLGYRLLATYESSVGTYDEPYEKSRHDFSLMAEATYTFSPESKLRNFVTTLRYGMDHGALLGDNHAFQLNIRYNIR